MEALQYVYVTTSVLYVSSVCEFCICVLYTYSVCVFRM